MRSTHSIGSWQANEHGTRGELQRREFRALSAALLASLAQALLKNPLQRMRAQARMAIDIVVRNLFERTADIGFLATDSAVRELLASTDADPCRSTARRAAPC